ncbi:helix-turn-helix domain-containing protein [Streptosporangium sp. NPDC020145]
MRCTEREQIRLEVAELFAHGYTGTQAAKHLRVSQMSADR